MRFRNTKVLFSCFKKWSQHFYRNFYWPRCGDRFHACCAINSNCRERIVRHAAAGNLTVAVGDRVENSCGSVTAEGFTMIWLRTRDTMRHCRITDRKRNIEQVPLGQTSQLISRRHATRNQLRVTEAPSYFCSTEFASQNIDRRRAVCDNFNICWKRKKIKPTWFVVL